MPRGKTICLPMLKGFCDRQSSKGNNSTSINVRVMVLRSACRLMLIDKTHKLGDNHQMIITAKYSSHHFTVCGENAI